MRIILLDERANFRNDVRNRLLIDDERNVELLTDMGDANSLDTAISRYRPDALVVADNIYVTQSAWGNIGPKVIGYVTRKENEGLFASDGTPAFGLIQSATHLLNLLEGGIPDVKARAQAAAPNMDSLMNDVPQKQVAAERDYGPQHQHHTPSQAESEIKRVSFNKPVDDDAQDPAFEKLDNSDATYSGKVAYTQMPASGNHQTDSLTNGTPRPDSGVYVNPAPSVKEQMDKDRDRRNTESVANSVMRDLSAKQTNTQTIAVYAAKGGVGKTTIATELAVFLSLISQGRGRKKVCLIDYNIDFGDVLTTLNLDKNGPNLTHWARDVRRRKMMGESAEDIKYNLQEIEGRLQCYNGSTLHVLVAPVVHEDSMEIESDELEIILKNIIDNGQFDFVICDTGNNTRDSTVIALDTSDVVLLIATQDVSAVNCDRSFLNTMSRVGFDTNKIRLVINSIMPYKYTQVEVREVEEMFPYPCIARIKRDPEVTKANNCSSPIVYQPNHEFTKAMRHICAHLTGQEIPEEPKKFDLLSIFRKKG